MAVGSRAVHLLPKTLMFTICKRCYMSLNLPALNERGVLNNVFPEVNRELEERLRQKDVSVYAGFDPTADSLHVGNLLPLMGLLHFQRAGIQPIVVIGGATVEVGDPSGRTTERAAMEKASVLSNLKGIRENIERIFANHEKFLWKNQNATLPTVKILNNFDWYRKMTAMDFFVQCGKYVRMGSMLRKDSVQSRLNSDAGMNFAEFSYQAFQAYDWFHLYKNHNCLLQLGGSDQLGNMDTGYDLIRRNGGHPYFFTVPLITSETGSKFGKSAGNAVWMTQDKMSPFEYYQFFMRIQDSEVENLLKLLTFFTDGELRTMMNAHRKEPEARRAQKHLAEQVTLLTHGEEGLDLAKRCTDAFYHYNVQALASLDADALSSLFGKAFVSNLSLKPGMSVIDTVLESRCFTNERDARRIIEAGGLYVNFHRVANPEQILIQGEHILPNKSTLIRVGKKNHYVVQWNM